MEKVKVKGVLFLSSNGSWVSEACLKTLSRECPGEAKGTNFGGALRGRNECQGSSAFEWVEVASSIGRLS